MQRKEVSLDDKCFEDYANLLLPKAVGYSAGLLNYFFRGSIGIELDQNSPDEAVVENLSSERMTGTFSLYYDDSNNNRNFVKGWWLDIMPYSPEYASLSACDLSNLSPKPEKFILAFQGKMGNETGAVVGNADINLLSSSCEDSLTIKGPDTLSQDNSEQFEITGCTGCEDDVNWEITGEGASMDKTGLLAIEKTACGGTATITAKCPVCKTEITKTITIPDPITISSPDSNNCYTASGGAGPYTWDISKGSIDSNGCVTTTTGQCGITTVTITDANGCKTTTTVTLPDTLTITGPEAPGDGSCYITTGGAGPYTWDITKGTIDENGCVDLKGQCGPVTVKAKDVNECTGKKDLKLPDTLEITGPDAENCYAVAGEGPYTWSITKGTIDENGCVDLTGQCGTATITVTNANGCMGTKDMDIPAEDLIISGSETTTTNSTKQYTASGCSSGVEWTVEGKGASITPAGLLKTDNTACGTLTITATCEGCGTSVTQKVRVTNAGHWVWKYMTWNNDVLPPPSLRGSDLL